MGCHPLRKANRCAGVGACIFPSQIAAERLGGPLMGIRLFAPGPPRSLMAAVRHLFPRLCCRSSPLPSLLGPAPTHPVPP